MAHKSGVWKFFFTVNAADNSRANCSLCDVVREIAAYLDQPPIPRTSCPRVWWRENESRFPALAGVARRFLGAPCTSVVSERLFSSAGLVYTDQRSRLAAERAEMLVFLKRNLPAINYSYWFKLSATTCERIKLNWFCVTLIFFVEFTLWNSE